MGFIRSFSSVGMLLVIVICSTITLSLVYKDNSTEIQLVDHDVARSMAYEAFMKISPFPRNCCLDKSNAPNDNFNANEIMDMVLGYLRTVIREKNLDRVDIPKFEETFTNKVGFVKVKGSFKGEDGWMESTLSIERKSDATVTLNDTSVLLDSTLGLNVLRLGMEYTARLSFIRVKGQLTAKVRSNAVSFSGGLDYSSGNCRLYLRRLKLSDLGKIDVNVTGLGKLNGLYSKIVTWVTKRFHDKIKYTVEKKMKGILEEELGKIKCPFPF